MHSLSFIKKPTKQTKKGIKKSSPSKSQTLLYFCIFKEYLKPAQTQTKAFQWSQSQAGPRSGNQCPRMESLASRFQGWQFPLSLLGDCCRARCHGITSNPSFSFSDSTDVFWPFIFWGRGRGESMLCSCKSQYHEHSLPKFPGEWSQI